jgi:hypothetical protein
VTDIISPAYAGPERRRRVRVSDSQLADLEMRVIDGDRLRSMLDDRFTGVEARLQAGDDRMFRLEEELSRNTRLTEDMAADTRETRELMEMGRALFKFASGFGRVIRWAAGLAAAASALWALWRDTPWPWKH